MDIEQRISEIFEGIKAKKWAPLAVFQGMLGIVRDVLAENARLQSVIDEANAQEPVASRRKDFMGNYVYRNESILGNEPLFASPVPAQQSPEIEVTPDMLAAAQKHSKLGGYACSNFAGGYSAITELFNVMLGAAPKQSPAVAVPDGARSFPRYLSVEARIKWKSRWDKNYSANPDAMWTLFWESVSYEEAPQLSPRITEQDARERILLEAIYKIESAHFRTVSDHGSSEHAQIVLGCLRGLIDLPMIFKRDLPAWDGEKYAMPVGSNLIKNQPALLNKLNGDNNGA